MKFREKKGRKLSHDSLYAFHLLVDHLNNYILSIKTTPDVEIVVGDSDIFDEVNKLLQLIDIVPEFYYDTTFNLGSFYVSTLVFRHPVFKEKPLLPIAFLVHERKFQKSHEHFLEILREKIPKLNEKSFPVIMDTETGIINAFNNILPFTTM